MTPPNKPKPAKRHRPARRRSDRCLPKQVREEIWGKQEEPETTQPSVVEEVISHGQPSFAVPGQISLPAHGWKCRPYQREFWNYMTDGDGTGAGKMACLNWHRRSGKDTLLLNLIAFLTTRRRGMYWHGFPLLNQGRKAIWEGYMNSESRRMLEYLPPALREDVNQQDLRINLKTGSTYMIVGGDNPDKLTGSGPIGVGFSEYAQMRESMWDYVSPILGENKGWAVFISTPRGKNHFYRQYQYCAKTLGCYASTLTIDDTWYHEPGKPHRIPVVPQSYIQGLRDQGKSDEFIRQEFYCDWNSSVEGAVYARQIKEMEKEGRVGDFPFDPSLPVSTAWDLGYSDSTAIIFWQLDREKRVRVIDFYVNNQQPIKHYCQFVRNKPYRYADHFGPWDVTHRSMHTANSVMDVALENGVTFQRLAKDRVQDGIEAVRANFPRMFFHKPTCEHLFDMLKLYTYEYDEDEKQFSETPKHDKTSHYADSLRYMCMALPRTAYAPTTQIYRPNPQPHEASWDVLNPEETYAKVLDNHMRCQVQAGYKGGWEHHQFSGYPSHFQHH